MNSGKLQEYVLAHTTRGECECGQCLVSNGTDEKPTGHTVNVTFFTVGLKGKPNTDEFLSLLKEDLPLFMPLFAMQDYITLGALLGDQGLALRFMALGHLLKVWRLVSPDTEYPERSKEERMNMAGLGGVVIVPNKFSFQHVGVA